MANGVLKKQFLIRTLVYIHRHRVMADDKFKKSISVKNAQFWGLKCNTYFYGCNYLS